jgi:N-acetylglucosaminyl-diphospho-decaprenol L-rhamnosyltransferase
VECLAIQKDVNFCAVIVDNASQDGSMSSCNDLDDRFVVLRLERNVGFAAANNLAAQRVSAQWVATLNPDAIPAVDWLKRLLGAAKRHPHVVMFGSTQINESDHSILEGTGDAYSCLGMMWRGQYRYPVSRLSEEGFVFSPCAAAALYRMDVFKSVGGFDENFFCYCEDVDLAFRMRLLGHECVQVKDSVVFHVGSLTAGRRSDFAIYHGFRNRLWTFLKNVPAPLFCLLLLPHAAATFLLLMLEIRRGHARAASMGLLDGFRRLADIAASRRRIQSSRTASTLDIAKAMTWSPIKMLRRSHDGRATRIGAR